MNNEIGENLFERAVNSTVNNTYVYGAIILTIMVAIYFTLTIHNLNNTHNQLPSLNPDKNRGGATIDNRRNGWIDAILAKIGSPQNSQIFILVVYFVLSLVFLFLYNRARDGDSGYGRLDLFSSTEDKIKKEMGMPIVNLMMKVGYVFGGLSLVVIVIGFILWMYNNFSQLHVFLSLLLTILNFVMILTLVYVVFKREIDKIINYKSNNLNFVEGIFKIIGEFIFIIPCLVLVLVDVVKSEIKITTPTVWIILIIEIVIICLYFLIPFLMTRLNTHDRQLLLQGPVYLDKRQMIGTYQNVEKDHIYRRRIEDHRFELFKTEQTTNTFDASTNTFQDSEAMPFNVTVDLDVDRSTSQHIDFNYNYGISLALYLNPQPTNTGQAYVQDTIIFDYAGKPKIVFNGLDQQLKFICRDINHLEKTVYETDDFKYQKWMNIVVNYRSGTVDIFIDGTLRATETNIQPFMEYSKIYVGSTPGIAGGIKDVMYFKEPLPLDKIRYINNMAI